MIDLNKLAAASEAAKAYQADAIKANSFGCFDEEGVFYELGNVCARIYERDENSDGSYADDALLNHIIAASPDAVLELIAMASAAAPQVVADEQKGSPYPEYDRGFSNGWDACAKRAAAPVQAQEPVKGIAVEAVLLSDMAEGGHHPQYGYGLFATENCVTTLYAATVQPVAMPDGDLVLVKRSAVEWMKKYKPVLCEKAGLLAIATPAAQGDVKDAERYHYIRDTGTLDAAVWAALEGYGCADEGDIDQAAYAAGMDQAIDAAIAAKAAS